MKYGVSAEWARLEGGEPVKRLLHRPRIERMVNGQGWRRKHMFEAAVEDEIKVS